ncbi:MAG: leucyl/phenylalanyl-tRNA--protein transferase [Phycisphaeraceae bacterium]|nr:leucyl/phenylalanyl-tRNA--protein transferase [Phycisphaeraceae bacterium]
MELGSNERVARMIGLYASGCFPMTDPETGETHILDPDPRAVMPLCEAEGFHVPRRLEATLRQKRFVLTSDEAFSDVVRACAAPRRPARPSESVSEQTWIGARLMHAYDELHHAGYAHSIEAWVVDGSTRRLVGGIFGVHIGGFFAGESMFSRPEIGGTNASKACLVALVRHLASRGVVLFDVQFSNPHLEQFGVRLWRRAVYHRMLRAAVGMEVTWGLFENV